MVSWWPKGSVSSVTPARAFPAWLFGPARLCRTPSRRLILQQRPRMAQDHLDSSRHQDEGESQPNDCNPHIDGPVHTDDGIGIGFPI